MHYKLTRCESYQIRFAVETDHDDTNYSRRSNTESSLRQRNRNNYGGDRFGQTGISAIFTIGVNSSKKKKKTFQTYLVQTGMFELC